MKKKTLFLPILAILFLAGCSGWQAKKLAKIDITDAQNIFVVSDSKDGSRAPGDSEKLYKETSAGEIVEVIYSSQDGDPMNFGLHLWDMFEIGEECYMMCYSTYKKPDDDIPAQTTNFGLYNFVVNKKTGAVYSTSSKSHLQSNLGKDAFWSEDQNNVTENEKVIKQINSKFFFLGDPANHSSYFDSASGAAPYTESEAGLWIADMKQKTMQKAKIPDNYVATISGFAVNNNYHIIYDNGNPMLERKGAFYLFPDGFLKKINITNIFTLNGEFYTYVQNVETIAGETPDNSKIGLFHISGSNKEVIFMKKADTFSTNITEYLSSFIYNGNPERKTDNQFSIKTDETFTLYTVENEDINKRIVREILHYDNFKIVETILPLDNDSTLIDTVINMQTSYFIYENKIIVIDMKSLTTKEWQRPDDLLTVEKPYVTSTGKLRLSGMDGYSNYHLFEITSEGSTIIETEGWDPKTSRLIQLN